MRAAPHDDMSEPTTVLFPRTLLKRFILMYKDFECLWNKFSPGYKIKMRRHDAITDLTKLVQEYDPSATRVHILRKIDSLRACVRREYKRVVESRRVATCDEEIYSPHLWYYDMFSFLVPEENDSKGKERSLDTNPVGVEQESEEEELEQQEEDAEETDPPDLLDDVKPELIYEPCVQYSQGPSKETHQEDRSTRKRRRRSDNASRIEDEYDAIGVNVAAKLRYLPENMRILAEKLISDVLFQAQTNALTSTTTIVTPDPFKF